MEGVPREADAVRFGAERCAGARLGAAARAGVARFASAVFFLAALRIGALALLVERDAEGRGAFPTGARFLPLGFGMRDTLPSPPRGGLYEERSHVMRNETVLPDASDRAGQLNSPPYALLRSVSAHA